MWIAYKEGSTHKCKIYCEIFTVKRGLRGKRSTQNERSGLGFESTQNYNAVEFLYSKLYTVKNDTENLADSCVNQRLRMKWYTNTKQITDNCKLSSNAI